MTEPTELEKRLAALANTGRSRVEVDPGDIARLLGMVASLRSAREEGRREGFVKAREMAAVEAYEAAVAAQQVKMFDVADALRNRGDHIRAMRDGAGEEEEAEPKGCNRHRDCAAVEAEAKAAGRPERYGPGSARVEHCHDSDCEDCIGR